MIKLSLEGCPMPEVGPAGRGHNNPPPDDLVSAASDQLRNGVARLERLEGEIDALNDDKREVYRELKASGLDPAVIRQVLRLRKQDPNVRTERNEAISAYMRALGMEA